MTTRIFTSTALHFSVSQKADGSFTWHGTYKGVPVKAVVPIEHDCIILLDPDASKERVFKNLLRVGQDGHTRWSAELPADPDVFLDVQSDTGCLAAHTWSGFRLRLDLVSGQPLAKEFVK
jgi:hypothetical protein